MKICMKKFMTMPQGYTRSSSTITINLSPIAVRVSGVKVYRLLKSLYGFKQAPNNGLLRYH